MFKHTLILPKKEFLTQRIVPRSQAKHELMGKRLTPMTTLTDMNEAIVPGIEVGLLLDACSIADTLFSGVAVDQLDTAFETCALVPRHELGLGITQSLLDVMDLGWVLEPRLYQGLR